MPAYIQTLPTLLTALVLMYLGFLVIRNERNAISHRFLAFVVSDSAWLLSVMVVVHYSWGATPFWGRLVFATVCALAMAIYAFVAALLHARSSKWAQGLVYGFGTVLFVASVATDSIVRSVKIGSPLPKPVYGHAFLLFVSYVIIVLVCLALLLFRADKAARAKGQDKQLDLVTAGLVGFAATGLLTNLVLPNLLDSTWSTQFVALGSLFLTACFWRAMAKYRLFDIRRVVVRSTTYVFLITIFAIVFVISANVFTSFVPTGKNGHTAQLAFNTILTLAIAVSFQPLKLFFDKITNEFFFKDAYDSQDVLNRLNKILISNTDINQMLPLCEDLLADRLKLEFCFFGLYESQSMTQARLFSTSDANISATVSGQLYAELLKIPHDIIDVDDPAADHGAIRRLLTTHNIAAVGKMSSHGDNIGFVAFGAKKSGRHLDRQDMSILDIVSNQMAIAIQNALRFEEIENFNATLQQKVDVATRKLRHTNEKLRQLDETKDEFISMASHQLRTPLTSVKGYVSMVLDGDGGKLSPLQRKLLNQAFISAQRMVYLISDLLNVSRLRNGRFVIEAVPTNLAQVVQEEVKQLVETAKGRNLELTYNRPEEFPTLMLDETKLRQVIMNFIDNAIYYTPSGGHITVALQNKPQTVEFTVTDDGIGVPKAEQHHLFSKFYRANNAKRARPDGTGLGLFMAKKVIAVQGGAVTFHSTEGQGSTFGFTFAKAPLAVLPKTEKSR